MIRKLSLAIGISMAFWGTTSYAAAFDCSKANGYVELTICTTPALSTLDDNLNALYKQVNRTQPQNSQLVRKGQLLWLKEIRNKATTAQMIQQAYQTRINDLNMMLGTQPAAPQTQPVEQVQPVQPVQQPQTVQQPQPAQQAQPVQQPQQPQSMQQQQQPQAKKDYSQTVALLRRLYTEAGQNQGAMIWYCHRHVTSNGDRGMQALIVWSMEQGQQTQQATDLGDGLYRAVKEIELINSPDVQDIVNEIKVRSVSLCSQLSAFAVQQGLVK